MQLTAWYNEVLPSLTGCTPEFALLHIRSALIEFCDRTQALVVDLDPVESNGATKLLAPDDFNIAKLMHVYLDGKRLLPKSKDDLIDIYGNLEKTGNAKWYYQESIDTINVYLISSGLLKINAAIKPNRTALEIDDTFAEKHFEAIAHGAKAKLFEIPSKPWTDNALSGYHMGNFDEAIHKARLEAIKGFGRQPLRTKLW